MSRRFTTNDLKNKGIHITPEGKAKKLDTIESKVKVKKPTEEQIKKVLQVVTENLALIKIKIKPLSVNDAWKGRRFRSDSYKAYQKEVAKLLPKQIELPKPPFHIILHFGFSSVASDWDNPIKPLQDCLAEKYKFNDKLIRKGTVTTEIVPKGEEFFGFEIRSLNPAPF